jgi:hypothetical protein
VDLRKKVFIQKPMFDVLAPLAPEYLSSPADESSMKLKAEVAQLKEYMASVVCSLQSVQTLEAEVKTLKTQVAELRAESKKRDEHDTEVAERVALRAVKRLDSSHRQEVVDEVVETLCDLRPKHARAVLEKSLRHPELLRVALVKEFHDIIPKCIEHHKKNRTCYPSDGYHSHGYYHNQHSRLSQDAFKNSWLRAIKGDGDVDDKVWKAMEGSGLLEDVGDVITMIAGVYQGNKKVTAKKLLFGGSKFNALFLHTAALQDNIDAVKCLLENNADINKTSSTGATPLHCAVSVSVAQYLVKSKCDLTIKDNEGRTPLAYAVNQRRSKIAAYLIDVDAPE